MTGAELVAAPWSRRDAAATSKTIGGGVMYRVARWSILAALCVFGSQPAHAQDAASKPKIVPPGEAAGAIGRDDDWTKWIELPEVAPYFDLRVRPLDADSGKHVGGDAPRNPRAASPTGEAIGPTDRFSLGIQTQKNLQNPFRQRSDCTNDDECAEYSGFAPKGEAPAKKSLKSFIKPYLGLSVTKPIE